MNLPDDCEIHDGPIGHEQHSAAALDADAAILIALLTRKGDQERLLKQIRVIGRTIAYGCDLFDRASVFQPLYELHRIGGCGDSPGQQLIAAALSRLLVSGLRYPDDTVLYEPLGSLRLDEILAVIDRYSQGRRNYPDGMVRDIPRRKYLHERFANAAIACRRSRDAEL